MKRKLTINNPVKLKTVAAHSKPKVIVRYPPAIGPTNNLQQINRNEIESIIRCKYVNNGICRHIHLNGNNALAKKPVPWRDEIVLLTRWL